MTFVSRIGKTERKRFVVEPRDEVVEITVPRRGEPRSPCAGRAALSPRTVALVPLESGADANVVAAAVARRQIDLRAKVAPEPLR